MPGDLAGHVDPGRIRRVIQRRIEVVEVAVPLVVTSEEAGPEAEVYRQAWRDVPVILDIRLERSRPVIILGLHVVLIEARDASQQEVSPGVACGDVGRVAEVQETLGLRTVVLVLLLRRVVKARVNVVRAPDLRDLIAERISRVGVVPWPAGYVRLESTAV